MNALVTASPVFGVNDIWKMAQAVAKSNLFGTKQPEQAMALMLIAQAEGTHPAIAARDYHIVDGRPTLKADAMLARFMQAGGRVEWHTYDDAQVKATFSHPQGGSVTIDWTLARAAKIMRKGKSLTDGDNWRNYPRAMLRARTVSEGIRTVFPGCVVGVYTPEEVQDFDDRRPAREVQAEVTSVEDLPPEEEPRATAEEMAINLLRGCTGDKAMFREAWEKNRDGWRRVMDGPTYERVVNEMKRLAATFPKDEPTPQQTAPADDFGLDGDGIPDFGDDQ